jgi:transposase
VAWLLRRPDAACAPEERAYLAALAAACPPLGEARALALRLTAMLADRAPDALAPWLADAEHSVLRALAVGLRRDYDAVLAALCSRWSNGQVEGHVHRLKLVKRSMYGRASFRLLRARVLHVA